VLDDQIAVDLVWNLLGSAQDRDSYLDWHTALQNTTCFCCIGASELVMKGHFEHVDKYSHSPMYFLIFIAWSKLPDACGRTHDVAWLVCCKKQRNLSCRLPKIAALLTT